MHIFKEINRQLEAHNIIIKTGAIVDASVIDTPLKPKGKTNDQVTEDRKDEDEIKVAKEFSDSVDKEASWSKKGGKYRFGYKKHHVTDNEGLVLGVVTTKASSNEVANLEEVLDSADLPEGIPLKADKGYQSKKNATLLKERKKAKEPYFKEILQKQAINSLGTKIQQTLMKNKV